MEATPSREDCVGHQPDRPSARKLRGDGGDAGFVVEGAEHRDDHKLGGDNEVNVARGLDRAVPISDATYWAVRAEVAKWRDAPGNTYRLDQNNCVHFVGKIAELAGIKVDYPKALIRKPKAWLNHITGLNPQFGAKSIK